MSQIDQLIAELAPAGVEFKALGEVLRIKNGKDHKALGDGDVPVYGSGGIMRYADTAAAVGPSVLIPRKGSLGNLFYVEGPFWVVDTIFRTEIDTSKVEPKFVYYKLLTMGLGEMNQAGGVPSQTQSVLNLLRIPVPPLPIQREIVRILDQFTQLEAELEAELEARRRQYEHYLRHLLAVPDEVEWTTLGDVTENHDRKRRPVTRSDRQAGEYPYYGANGVQDFVHDFIFDGTFLLIGEDGSVKRADGTPVLNWATGRIWVNNHAHVLTSANELLNLRYLFHYLKTVDISALVSGGTQPKLNQRNLNQIAVPLVPRVQQDRIVEILDNFDALVNDLSAGLPAEITARRKQYEFYRDKLLTFEEPAA